MSGTNWAELPPTAGDFMGTIQVNGLVFHFFTDLISDVFDMILKENIT